MEFKKELLAAKQAVEDAKELVVLVLNRFEEEQPERELSKTDKDAIFYQIYGRLFRGETKEEIKSWCLTVPLQKKKIKSINYSRGY